MVWWVQEIGGGDKMIEVSNSRLNKKTGKANSLN